MEKINLDYHHISHNKIYLRWVRGCENEIIKENLGESIDIYLISKRMNSIITKTK